MIVDEVEKLLSISGCARLEMRSSWREKSAVLKNASSARVGSDSFSSTTTESLVPLDCIGREYGACMLLDGG
jgi:hypothetical protein